MTIDDEDSEQPSPTEAAAPVGRGGIWLALATIVAALLLSAAVSLTAPRLSQLFADWLPGQRQAQPSPLEQKVAALDQRLARLEVAQAETPERAQAAVAEGAALGRQVATLRPQVASIGALTNRLDKLESRIKAVAAQNERAADSGDPAALAALGQRLRELETAAAGRGDEALRGGRETAALKQQLHTLAADLASARAESADLAQRRSQGGGSGALVALALGRLRDAVGNRPFADQLAALRQLIPEPAAESGFEETLSQLEKRAGGVASRPDLARRFAALAGPAVRAGAGQDEGWLAATRRRLSGLVSLRRTGPAAGSGVEARVARAEAALAEGDLAAALAEVAVLEGGAAEVLAPWRRAASDRLAVESALAALEARLPDLLQAAESP
jgi:uroporphyrinogen-III synthase